jgi:multicomponent Na+:H+ antiporter subunit G
MLAEGLGGFFILFGLFFYVMGVAGLVRFPDVYARIHAAGKVSTLGILGLLVGTAFIMPATTLRVIALLIFVVVTAPVASHAIANAAYRSGVAMTNPVRNDLLARDQAKAESEIAET